MMEKPVRPVLPAHPARSVRSPGHAPAYLESRIASMDLDSTSDLIDSQ